MEKRWKGKFFLCKKVESDQVLQNPFYKEKVERFLNFQKVGRKELEAIQVNVQNRVGDTHLQHIVGELKEWVKSLGDVNVEGGYTILN